MTLSEIIFNNRGLLAFFGVWGFLAFFARGYKVRSTFYERFYAPGSTRSYSDKSGLREFIGVFLGFWGFTVVFFAVFGLYILVEQGITLGSFLFWILSVVVAVLILQDRKPRKLKESRISSPSLL